MERNHAHECCSDSNVRENPLAFHHRATVTTQPGNPAYVPSGETFAHRQEGDEIRTLSEPLVALFLAQLVSSFPWASCCGVRKMQTSSTRVVQVFREEISEMGLVAASGRRITHLNDEPCRCSSNVELR